MVRNLGKGNASVFRSGKKFPGLGTHKDSGHINGTHEDTCQDTGTKHISGNGGVILYAHGADDIDDHNSKGQTGNGVHGTVAFDDRGEENVFPESFLRCNG